MLNILEQLYPQEEHIDIELLGVDILGELVIEPLDYKLRIHKSKSICKKTVDAVFLC